MSEQKEPTAIEPLAAPFWDALGESIIRVQRCLTCGYLRWPPGPVCPECQSREAEWSAVGNEGTLVSYAIYHRALDPGFADEVPYVVGLIELVDGPRLYGNVVGDRDALRVDGHVRAVFETSQTGEPKMVRWRMAD